MGLREKQFSIDLGVSEDVLDYSESIFNTGFQHPDMRYYARSHGVIILSNNKVFVRCDDKQLTQLLETTYRNTDGQWFSEFTNLSKLQQLLDDLDYRISNYTPYLTHNRDMECDDPNLCIIEQEEIKSFKNNDLFKECFIFEEQDPDLLGVAYKINGEIVGVAGCNQMGKYTAELGINVIPEYQRQGIGTKLTIALTNLMKGRYPNLLLLYGTQFSHIHSLNTAIKAGYTFSWTEITIVKT